MNKNKKRYDKYKKFDVVYVYKITQKWKSKGTRTRFIAYKFIKVAVPYFSITNFFKFNDAIIVNIG